MPSEWLHVVTSHQERWFRASDVSYIETPGDGGKPSGWLDGVAAVVSLKYAAECIALDAEQWAQLKRLLSLAASAADRPASASEGRPS